MALKFCAQNLQADTAVGGLFLSEASRRLSGKLKSLTFPSDLQRHEVGPDGDVLHLQRLGLPQSAGGAAPSGPSSAKAPRKKPLKTAGSEEAPQPWVATFYSRGANPQSAKQRLAKELRLPSSAFRTGPLLTTPGCSVQHISLPRGLPQSLVGNLPSSLGKGLLEGTDPMVAVGRGGEPEDTGVVIRSRPASIASQKQRVRRPWRCEGHRYSVILRDLNIRQVESGEVDNRMQDLIDLGFVNSFDASSFGRAEVRRYEIGAALWTGQWDMAARLILTANRSAEGSMSEEAIKAFARGDLATGIELLPDRAEGMRNLAMQLLLGKKPLEALQSAMPVAVWGRYLSSVSKLAWNHAVVARLTKLPRRPLPGDLVWDGDSGETRHLRVDEVKKFEMSDLLMPLPRPSEYVPECLGRLDLERTLRDLSPKRDADAECFPLKVSTLLPQARRMIAIPTDVSWDILEAKDGPMVPCDLENLGVKVSELSGADEATPTSASSSGRGRRKSRTQTSPGIALRMRFTLPRTETPEALLCELVRAGPADFLEKLDRRDELF